MSIEPRRDMGRWRTPESSAGSVCASICMRGTRLARGARDGREPHPTRTGKSVGAGISTRQAKAVTPPHLRMQARDLDSGSVTSASGCIDGPQRGPIGWVQLYLFAIARYCGRLRRLSGQVEALGLRASRRGDLLPVEAEAFGELARAIRIRQRLWPQRARAILAALAPADGHGDRQ
jgi:hypothetical protein